MIKKESTYLVCPLNWGLGHASRMIPIISQLQNKDKRVILGGDGMALELLKRTFPELNYIIIPDINIKFKSNQRIFQLFKIAFQLIRQIKKEHYLLKKIVKKHSIDIVISDNRYGLWNKKIKSIIYTHQLMVKLPSSLKIMEYPIHCLIKKLLINFEECRIPDYKNTSESLSGDLAHKYTLPKNAYFIGPLSRFSVKNTINFNISTKNFEIVAVLSGPEPARSTFEHKLLSSLKTTQRNTLLIRGITNSKDQKVKNAKNITIYNTIDSSHLQFYLTKAKLIICRSGYSSIMDLHTLGLKALFIPTPGQTEQEYLANYNSHNNIFIEQYNINSKQFLSILSDS